MKIFGKGILVRAWALAALGLLVAVLVGTLVLVSMVSMRISGNTVAAPTPCPDTIACHALKRMSTSVVQP